MAALVSPVRHHALVRAPLFSADSNVGELAVPVRALGPGTSLTEVDELFRREPLLHSLVVLFDDGPGLLTRTGLQQLMIGPLGFGRAVHSRRGLRELVDTDVLLLAAGTPLGQAAQQLLARDPARRYDDALVRTADGLGLLAVSSVFEQLARHFAHQSVHDPLTGLANRLLLAEGVRRLPAAAPGSVARSALLYVDLDGFKAVNDDFGHDVGDAVLLEYARRLRDAVRPDDVVARLGGDEFALLLVDPVTDVQASAVADRLVLLAAAPFLIGDVVVRVGASVGIARAGDEVEQHVDEVEALLRSADLAMYRAKTRGRGCAERGAPEVTRDERGNDGRDLDRRLAQALDRGALSLSYQPKFELATGRLLEHEALARWVDDSGPVSPAVFIPAAERSGLIHRLGQWALQEACEQAQTWTTPDGDRAGPVVAVNVSPRQLADPCFVACVAEVLARTGLPASRLCLEITETAAIHDLAATRHQLHELRSTGVLIALDDFGTGYSSLTLLRVLPIDWVKIDRSFVEDVADDTSGAVLVRLVIEAAHSLGVRVCAEGVERPEQLARLLTMGCDAVQGFLLGVPARIPSNGLPCGRPVSRTAFCAASRRVR